ncbi:MAG: hypothetical protein ACAI43_16225 [Phycisphaerae bacterium]|nr:hypothetical protein [Tepidisphaeraceae bacterium]
MSTRSNTLDYARPAIKSPTPVRKRNGWVIAGQIFLVVVFGAILILLLLAGADVSFNGGGGGTAKKPGDGGEC